MRENNLKVGLTIDQFNGIKPSILIEVVRKLGLEFVELTSSVFHDFDACKKSLCDMLAGLHLPNLHDKGYDFSNKNLHEQIKHLIKLINENYKDLNIQY